MSLDVSCCFLHLYSKYISVTTLRNGSSWVISQCNVYCRFQCSSSDLSWSCCSTTVGEGIGSFVCVATVMVEVIDI